MMNHNCCCGQIRLRTGVRIVGWLIALYTVAILAAAGLFWWKQRCLHVVVVLTCLGFVYVPADVAFFCMVCTSKFDSVFSRKFFRAAIVFAFTVQLVTALLVEGLLIYTSYYLRDSPRHFTLGFYVYLLYSVALAVMILASVLFHCFVLKLTRNYIELGKAQISYVVEKPKKTHRQKRQHRRRNRATSFESASDLDDEEYFELNDEVVQF